MLDDFKQRATDFWEFREDLVSDFAIVVEKGVIKGYEDGTFRSSYNITRSEMAIMISQVLNMR